MNLLNTDWLHCFTVDVYSKPEANELPNVALLWEEPG